MFKRKSIKKLEQDLDAANSKIEELQEENVILLDNCAELRSKLIDAENNIELLVNNSRSKKIKELFASTTQDK